MDRPYIYTIIIPHHNIPDLLRRCLSSIPHREDVQVIVIDDNSKAGHQPALRLLEQAFPWVDFLYSKEGKGAGHARNIGLAHAQGTYILFADADDYFNFCINQVLDDYAHATYDVVFFDANSLDTDTYTTAYRSLHLNTLVRCYKKHPSRSLFGLRYAFGEPWCKMVKREIIEKNGIQFSETIIHNDTRYSYLVGYYCQDIQVDKRALYCVTDRNGSVSKQISIDRLLTRTAVFAEANRFFSTHDIHRFDERGLRPLIGFLMKLDAAHARQCMDIMKSYGMTTFSILLHIAAFPFYVMGKSKLLLKKTILKHS